MTQKNYFGGAYLGCDVQSGLGFPDWANLASAYGISCFHLAEEWYKNADFLRLWRSSAPALFLVPIHGDQTYFPKISSRVNESEVWSLIRYTS